MLYGYCCSNHGKLKYRFVGSLRSFADTICCLPPTVLLIPSPFPESKYFTWDPDVLTEEIVYNTWLHQASIRYSGMLNRFKETRAIKKPDSVSEDAWRVWNAYWDNPKTVDKCETQRQNRLSEVDGEGTGISRHRGGTKTYIEHLATMEKELGRPIQPLEFLQRMQCKDGQFIDDRSKNVVDKVQNHINTMIRANGGSLEGIDMSKAYMETVGTIKKNVYGLGSWGQTLINNGVNASTTSSTNQDEFFKNLKEELEQQFRTEMETLKAQMEAQVQSQVQSQVQEVMLALFRFGSYPPAANGRPPL